VKAVRPVALHPFVYQGKAKMSDMMLLTDAELDLVAGGVITIGTNSQTNSSSISQSASATASNSGAVTAIATGAYSTAAAAGAEASAANVASVDQSNSVG
jgi:hypothetical protein